MKILTCIIFVFPFIINFVNCNKYNDHSNALQNTVESDSIQLKISFNTPTVNLQTDTVKNDNIYLGYDTIQQDSRFSAEGIGKKGDVYPRYATFIDSITGKTIKKIDLFYIENPYLKQGLQIDFLDGSIVYYKLPNGVLTTKYQLRRFLPVNQFEEIPDTIGEAYCMGFIFPYSHQKSKYLIVSYQFECFGLGREYIRGDFTTSIFLIFDDKGGKLLEYKVEGRSNGGSNDLPNFINELGEFACMRYIKYDADYSRRKVVTEIIHLESKKIVFQDSVMSKVDNDDNYWIWYPSQNLRNIRGLINYENLKNSPSQFVKAVVFDNSTRRLYEIEKPENYSYNWRNNTQYFTHDHFGLINTMYNDTLKFYFTDLLFKNLP